MNNAKEVDFVSGETVVSGRIFDGKGVKRGRIVADAASGLIKDVQYMEESNGSSDYEYSGDYVICAGDVNGHSHPEQSIYTDIADKSWDLSTWCRNTIYKYSPYLKAEHIYYACCRAFSRMLAYGVTTVFVSFYCHNNKGNEHDKAVIKAACDMGIRLYFGRMNYDIITPDAYEAKKKSQHCYFEAVEEAERNFIELLESTQSENVVVAPAIHSIHASTGAAIENALKLGSKYDRYVQFHLSEDSGDVDLSMKWYGLRPVEYLAGLVEKGIVSSLDNLLLSDCIWIDENELDLIKQYNIRVVLNPRMNRQIKAGEAKLLSFVGKGIPLYLGTDGEASNDDLSITGELEYLRKRYPDLAGEISAYFTVLPLKFGAGKVGKIEKGCYCDLKVMNDNRPKDVFVGGKRVIESGRLSGKDMESDIERPLKAIVKELTARE